MAMQRVAGSCRRRTPAPKEPSGPRLASERRDPGWLGSRPRTRVDHRGFATIAPDLALGGAHSGHTGGLGCGQLVWLVLALRPHGIILSFSPHVGAGAPSPPLHPTLHLPPASSRTSCRDGFSYCAPRVFACPGEETGAGCLAADFLGRTRPREPAPPPAHLQGDHV